MQNRKRLESRNWVSSDLRGINFSKLTSSNEDLEEHDFSDVVAGISKYYALISVVIYSSLLSFIPGFSFTYWLSSLGKFIVENAGYSLELISLILLTILFVFFKSVFQQGLRLAGVSRLITLLIIAFSIATLLGAITSSESLATVILLLAISTLSSLFTSSLLVISIVTSYIISPYATVFFFLAFIAGSILGSAFVFTTSIIKLVVMFTLLLFVSVFMPSLLIIRQTIKGNINQEAARKIAIWLAICPLDLPIGTTSFRGANLSRARFIRARVRGTDFREAKIEGVDWSEVKGLDWVRIDNTYLQYPKVRQLLQRKNRNGVGIDLSGLNLEGINLEGFKRLFVNKSKE